MKNSMIFILLLGLHLALSLIPESSTENLFCGTPLKDSRVINGIPAEENKYPWMVALYAGATPLEDPVKPNYHICGGTLITSQSVLTAAHCIDQGRPLYVGLSNGSVLNNNFVRIPAAQITVHPKFGAFDTLIVYDYAIITLARPVEFTKTLLPVCLPDPNKDYSNVSATLTGWGFTRGGVPSPSDILMTSTMTTLTREECQILNTLGEVGSSVICTNTPGTSGCNGDSGGPLVTLGEGEEFYTQIGVMSYGDLDCTMESGFNAFASVMDQLYWIALQVTGETLPAPVPRGVTRYTG